MKKSEGSISYLIFFFTLFLLSIIFIGFFTKIVEREKEIIKKRTEMKSTFESFKKKCIISDVPEINELMRKYIPDINIYSSSDVDKYKLSTCDKIVIISDPTGDISEQAIELGKKPLLVGNFTNDTYNFLKKYDIPIYNNTIEFNYEPIIFNFTTIENWECDDIVCKFNDINKVVKIILNNDFGYMKKQQNINLSKYTFFKITLLIVINNNLKIKISLDNKVNKTLNYLSSSNSYRSYFFKINRVNYTSNNIYILFNGKDSVLYLDRLVFFNGAFINSKIYFSLVKNIDFSHIIKTNVKLFDGEDKFSPVYLKFNGRNHPFIYTSPVFYYLNDLNIKENINESSVMRILVNYLNSN